MRFEPVKKFWIAPTSEELAAENARLKSWLLALAVLAVFGWAGFGWSVWMINSAWQLLNK